MRATLGFAPTVRLAIIGATIAPLWLLSGWRVGAVIAALAMLGALLALIVDVAALPSTDDVDVRREFPDTVGVGDAADGTYTVSSRWGRGLYVTLFDALPSKHVAGAMPFAEAMLEARGATSLPFRVTGADRGDAPLGEVAVRVRTPLGLASRTFKHTMTDRVLVAPSLAGVKRFRWLAVHHRLATVGVRNTPRRGEGRSFSRLRDYTAGDDPRHIDWKATARRGHPITREFTVEQSQTVYILVDAGRSMTQLSGRYPRFEYALSAALLLADVTIHAGDRVGALVFDDQLRALVPAQRGITALHALRTALVPLQPTLVEPDYATAFRTLAQRQ